AQPGTAWGTGVGLRDTTVAAGDGAVLATAQPTVLLTTAAQAPLLTRGCAAEVSLRRGVDAGAALGAGLRDAAILATAQPTALPTVAVNTPLRTVGVNTVRALLAVVPAAEQPARTTARDLTGLVTAR
ncbi:MAG: hypothetical protein ACRDR6_01720, partial [Pseudonocardiaceae bacterium]